MEYESEIILGSLIEAQLKLVPLYDRTVLGEIATFKLTLVYGANRSGVIPCMTLSKSVWYWCVVVVLDRFTNIAGVYEDIELSI